MELDMANRPHQAEMAQPEALMRGLAEMARRVVLHSGQQGLIHLLEETAIQLTVQQVHQVERLDELSHSQALVPTP